MEKPNFKQILLIGLTLFSMFFGAGNLIFAPYMGVQAGTSAMTALLGFICTAVVLPISAVVIISRYGDAVHMVSTISHKLAVVFISLIYLLIGPCIAIPRTASTSFEMFEWLLSGSMEIRIGYTVVFFALCMLTARKPGKLKDVLGKIMGPILVIMILFLTIGSFFQPGLEAAATVQYSANPFLTGFTEGYQTMDILAAFCFGIVILLNIQQAGYTDKKLQRSILIKAAFIAGGLLAALYALLCISGMLHAASYQSLTNGAQILSALAGSEFGNTGTVIISLIFFVACYNVCSGLLSCCSEYFHELSGKGTYLQWLAGFTAAGAIVAVFGLDAILAVSAPILSWICPIAILFLLWGIVWPWLQKNKETD